MITAVDTNVLLDVFDRDPVFLSRSLETLRSCEAEGSLIVCDVVWAEIASRFPPVGDLLPNVMNRVGIGFNPMSPDAALAAGVAWRAYRRRGGSRTRIVADFLIGAHALVQADRLLTRDSRFHRSYFQKLTVLDPTES